MGTYDPAVAGDRVTADNRAAGRIAARHLRALGHRRIAFFGPGAARIAQNTSLRDRARRLPRGPGRDAPSAVGPPGRGGTAALEALEPLEPLEPLELPDALPEALDDQRRLRRLLEFLDRTGAAAAVTCNDALAALPACATCAPGACASPSTSPWSGSADAPPGLGDRGPADHRTAGRPRHGRRGGGVAAAPPGRGRLTAGAGHPARAAGSCGPPAGPGRATTADPYEPADATQDAVVALQPALDR